MGCAMSRSHLRDDGLAMFRNPHHSKPDTKPTDLLIKQKSESSILDQPPMIQKINTTGDGNSEPLWFGSPSFREYVQSVPDDDDVTTSGDGKGKEIVIGKEGKEQADNIDTRGGRFRKVFQVQRVSIWPGRAWRVGHPKATRKGACT